MDATLSDYLKTLPARGTPFFPSPVGQNLPHGDMPGDKILIQEEHIQKANILLPALASILADTLNVKKYPRCVVGVCGGSGVGKSEISSLLGWYLQQLGVSCYILSGDNYPYRIPSQNDAERLRIFRDHGLKGLLTQEACPFQAADILHELMIKDQDADPALCHAYPWLSIYQAAGRNGLKDYLGSPEEIDFPQLNHIIAQFQNGAQSILLKRMGRKEDQLLEFPQTVIKKMSMHSQSANQPFF